MKKKIFSLLLCLVFIFSLLPVSSLAFSDPNNGDWSSKTVTLKGTKEAELMVRVGDIDACNDEYAVDQNGYNPFTAKDQYSHGFPWKEDPLDPQGTDRIYVGSKETGSTSDGYSNYYYRWLEGEDCACAKGALTITINYDVSDIKVKSALLQLCIDDFQALNWKSNFTVTLNGREAPFIAEQARADADGERAGIPHGVEQAGAPAQFVYALGRPGQVFHFFISGVLQRFAVGRGARGERLALVERLCAHFAHMVYPHQAQRVLLLRRAHAAFLQAGIGVGARGGGGRKKGAQYGVDMGNQLVGQHGRLLCGVAVKAAL